MAYDLLASQEVLYSAELVIKPSSKSLTRHVLLHRRVGLTHNRRARFFCRQFATTIKTADATRALSSSNTAQQSLHNPLLQVCCVLIVDATRDAAKPYQSRASFTQSGLTASESQ